MGNIYNCLSSVYQQLKQENNRNPAFIFIILALLSIPLSYAANSISIGILAVTAIFTFKKKGFHSSRTLLVPVALYAFMALSMLWSIDIQVTGQALLKEIPLLIVPLCFMAFPLLTQSQRQRIISYYSYGIALYGVFYLLKATVRFCITGNNDVFFYHELVTLDVNAIHVSVYVAVAFFYFLSKGKKSTIDFAALTLLFVLLFLLSSKNIILVFSALVIIYGLFYSTLSKKLRYVGITFFVAFLFSMALTGKIQERFRIEYETAMTDNTLNAELTNEHGNVYNVSIRDAWNKEKFAGNEFFPGVALRVFQLRIFTEMIREDNIFFTGYGLNASYPKIQQKVIEHNLYLGDGNDSGYQKNNFHNQYIQNFAELGFFGFLVLIIMLAVNLKNAVQRKDFTHISFAILMISLFLTESFLWRQRGVTFFIMMYCIFNSATLNFAPEKNKKL